MKHLFAGFLFLVVAACVAAQPATPRIVQVNKATRLDWKFAAGGFGPKAAKLPNGYDSTKQKYQLFVPKNYAKTKAWPLIVFISPGNSPAGWKNWRKTCEANGVFFCSPFAAGNRTPTGQRTRIVLDMLDDVRSRYRIDADRTYLSGFSGGGRMACAIGYRLPEMFGGVAPVCGTNPLPSLTYLRHRIGDRLSVAFITGEKDFNRKENEVWMAPMFAELRIRSKLWLVPKMGHSIPGASTINDVWAWLEQGLPRRRANRKTYPHLHATFDKTTSVDEFAAGYLKTSLSELKNADRVWRGVALLQGVLKRWPNTAAGRNAKRQLQQVVKNAALLARIDKQGGADERRTLLAQAKGFERMGFAPQAKRAWQMLATHHPNTPEGRLAAKKLRR